MIAFAIFICNIWTHITNYLKSPSLIKRFKLATAKIASMTEEINQLRLQEIEYQRMYATAARYAAPLLANFDRLKSQNRVLQDMVSRMEFNNRCLQQSLHLTRYTASEESMLHRTKMRQVQQCLAESKKEGTVMKSKMESLEREYQIARIQLDLSREQLKKKNVQLKEVNKERNLLHKQVQVSEERIKQSENMNDRLNKSWNRRMELRQRYISNLEGQREENKKRLNNAREELTVVKDGLANLKNKNQNLSNRVISLCQQICDKEKHDEKNNNWLEHLNQRLVRKEKTSSQTLDELTSKFEISQQNIATLKKENKSLTLRLNLMSKRVQKAEKVCQEPRNRLHHDGDSFGRRLETLLRQNSCVRNKDKLLIKRVDGRIQITKEPIHAVGMRK